MHTSDANKTATLNLRITPKTKQRIIKQAREENRSITEYIEWLVLQDAINKQSKKP